MLDLTKAKKMRTKCPQFFLLVEIVSLFEFVHASAGVDKFLFAREVWMALGADFNSEFLHILRCAGLESVSASADDCDVMVLWMDTFFHFRSPNLIFTPTRTKLCAYDIKFLYYINCSCRCQAIFKNNLSIKVEPSKVFL